jgi:hypothetical protein
MSEKNLEALFLHSLKELYFAEQQALKGLPAMARAAESEELRAASRRIGARRKIRSDAWSASSRAWTSASRRRRPKESWA